MNTSETLGQKLQRLRAAAGLTQSQVATAAAVPLTSLQNWELDRREPGFRTAVALARVLGVTAEDLADSTPVAPVRKVRPPIGPPPPVKPLRTKDYRMTRVTERPRRVPKPRG